MGYRNHKLLESGRTVINMGRGIKAVRQQAASFGNCGRKYTTVGMIAAESAIIRWNFGTKSIRASGITSETRSAISAPANMRCAAKSVWRGAGSVGCSAGSGVICAGSAGERAWANPD